MEDKEWRILPASWRDLGGLQVLEKQSFPQDAWPIWDLIGILALPNITRLKVDLRGRMIGFLAAEYKPKEQAVWIAVVGVLPAYQGLGIGSALLEVCENSILQSTIRLCVRKSNIAAQKMYLKHGYKIDRVWNTYYHDGEDALVMEKRLTGRL